MLRDIIRDAIAHFRNPRTRLHRLQRRRARLEARLARFSYRRADPRRVRRVEDRLHRVEILIEDTKREIKDACTE